MKRYFCNKYSNYNTSWDIRYFFKIYPSGHSDINKDINFFIPDLNKKSCYDCGISYFKNKYSNNNKIKKILNRQISGKMKNTRYINYKFIDIKEYCSICNEAIKSVDINTPIFYRENYVEGIGQLCCDCYYKYAL